MGICSCSNINCGIDSPPNWTLMSFGWSWILPDMVIIKHGWGPGGLWDLCHPCCQYPIPAALMSGWQWDIWPLKLNYKLEDRDCVSYSSYSLDSSGWLEMEDESLPNGVVSTSAGIYQEGLGVSFKAPFLYVPSWYCGSTLLLRKHCLVQVSAPTVAWVCSSIAKSPNRSCECIGWT